MPLVDDPSAGHFLPLAGPPAGHSLPLVDDPSAGHSLSLAGPMASVELLLL